MFSVPRIIRELYSYFRKLVIYGLPVDAKLKKNIYIYIYWFILVIYCLDIDECAENIDGCSNDCQNLEDTYICTSPEGFEVDSSKKNCIGKKH